MKYKIEDIKKGVRILLDQNMHSDALVVLADVDTLAMEQVIEARIMEAVRLTLEDAPLQYLGGGKALPTVVEWESAIGHGAGTIRLPKDFLRLISFKMSDWNRAVHHPISPDTPQYAMMQSPFSGLRGTPTRPVVAIVPAPEGLLLEFYSCTGGDNVRIERAHYYPTPTLSSGEIDIPPLCYESVLWRTAYFVSLTYDLHQSAPLFLQTALHLLGKEVQRT